MELDKLVVHIGRVSHYDTYIGRVMPRFGLAASIWENPFIINLDGNRAEVLRLYEERLWGRADLLLRLPDLGGKILACWCAPAGGLGIDDPLQCHGQVLLRALREERARYATR